MFIYSKESIQKETLMLFVYLFIYIVTNSFIKCKIEYTTPSQQLQTRQKLDPNTCVLPWIG
jgi:hypothetical protein